MTDHLRDALLRLDDRDRRLLLGAAHKVVNKDPSEQRSITKVMAAVVCTLVDIDTDAKVLAEQLEELWDR